MQHSRPERSALWALCLLACAASGCPESDALSQLGAAGKAGSSAAGGGEPLAGLPASSPGSAGAGHSAADGGSGGQAGSEAAASGGGGSAGQALAGRGAGPRRGGGGRVAAGSGGAGEGGQAARAGAGGQAGHAGAQAAAAGSGGVPSDCVQNLTCQLAALPGTGDAHQDCVDRVNQFRTQCACLPALARWNDGEACADMMAEYDSSGTTAHAGFMANICKGGSAQNECPGWQSETQVVSGCLQQMWNEGPPPSSDCTGSCFQKYGHFINMTNTRMKKVACGFFKTEQGKVWSVQNFSQ